MSIYQASVVLESFAAKIGMTFTHYNQPYGTVVFTIDKVSINPQDAPYRKGWIRLEGFVVTGGETSRFFQHTSTRDLKGTRHVLEVPAADLEKGSKGWIRLEGVVVTGGETSRFFQHTSTRDLKGTRHVLEVPAADLEKGSIVTVAM